jgi:hypothetical protein
MVLGVECRLLLVRDRFRAALAITPDATSIRSDLFLLLVVVVVAVVVVADVEQLEHVGSESVLECEMFQVM